jgi:hypothetical protein
MILCPANEAHTGHAEPVGIQRFLGCGDEGGMIGQAEIVVSAQIQDALAAGDSDVCILGRGQKAGVAFSAAHLVQTNR